MQLDGDAVTLGQRIAAFEACCDEPLPAARAAATALFHSRLLLVSAFGQQALEELHPLPIRTSRVLYAVPSRMRCSYIFLPFTLTPSPLAAVSLR